MSPQYDQLGFGPLVHCQTCPGSVYCGDGRISHPCPLEYEPAGTERSRALHPLSPDLGLRLADCRGLEFSVVARPQELPELPRYIPCVTPRDFVRWDPSVMAVAVPLDAVVSDAGRSTRRGLGIRDRLGIYPGTKLVLTAFARDKLLEGAWPLRLRIVRELADLRPDLVTGFGYSLYDDDPRLEHMYNMKRSLVTYELWQQCGVPAVPCISWFSLHDLDRWCEWLDRNASVNMVAIDLQCARAPIYWASALKGLQYLWNNAPRDLAYFVHGVAKPERLAILAEHIPHLHVCNQGPLFMAIQGHETEFKDGRSVRRKSDWLREDIFRSEVHKMQGYVLPTHAYNVASGGR